MKLQSFYELQINLLQSICLSDLSFKSLIRQAKTLINLYKKSRQFLRDDSENKHWKQVKEISLNQISFLPGLLNLYIIELTPEEDQLLISCMELVNICSVVLYEESRLDTDVLKYEEVILTKEQITALSKLTA